MGAKFSKYFMSRKQQLTKAMVGSSSSSSSSDGKPSSAPRQGPTSIIELIKPECLKRKKIVKEKRIRHLNPAEKKNAEARKLTLEDWLLASPGGPGLKPERFSGELHVFKQFSNRVHPSAARVVNEATTSRPRESFSQECENPCVSSSQSGKLKKKVSFKLPEEADIIIFHSPEVALGSE